MIPTFRFFANLRMNLLPYVWSEAIKSSRSGVPMMRALPLEFPEDPKVFDYPFQYMFGDGLLVAPVAWEGCDTLEVYLPEGEWYDFWSGQRHAGPKTVRYPTPKNTIPVFVRAGSVIALNLDDSLTLGSAVGNGLTYRRLHIRAYPAKNRSRFEWFEDPSRAPTCFDIEPYE